MKKISTLILMMLLTLAIKAQSTHTVDFETDGIGADWEWSISENGDNPDLEFTTNPDATGINTSSVAAMFTARSGDDSGMNWALCYTSDDGEFTFDEDNSTITIMVYKTTISNVAIKVEGFDESVEIKLENTVTDAWEELSYDFSAYEGNVYDKLVIIPDYVDWENGSGTDRDAETIVYFDNIEVPDGTVVDLDDPETAASTPTKAESNVLSIYCDAYTDVADTDFNPSWGQSTAVTYETIGDNNVLKYAGLDYQGTDFGSQDVSSYDYVHIDYWSTNTEELSFYLVGSNVSGDGSGEVEYPLTISLDTWVSTDIALSEFSSTVDLTDAYQFKITGNGTVWIDNLYFWSDVSTAVEQTTATSVSLYPNPASDILYLKGVNDGELVTFYSSTGSVAKRELVQSGKVSVADLTNGLYIIKVDTEVLKFIKQ